MTSSVLCAPPEPRRTSAGPAARMQTSAPRCSQPRSSGLPGGRPRRKRSLRSCSASPAAGPWAAEAALAAIGTVSSSQAGSASALLPRPQMPSSPARKGRRATWRLTRAAAQAAGQSARLRADSARWMAPRATSRSRRGSCPEVPAGRPRPCARPSQSPTCRTAAPAQLQDDLPPRFRQAASARITIEDKAQSNGLERALARVINCECGQTVRAESDDEIVALVEGHVQADHPRSPASCRETTSSG